MSTSEISRIEKGPKTDSISTPLQPARQNMVSCTVGYAQAENFEPGYTITLESLGIQFPIEDVYEGTSLTYH
jgi:hypothetical protein